MTATSGRRPGPGAGSPRPGSRSRWRSRRCSSSSRRRSPPTRSSSARRPRRSTFGKSIDFKQPVDALRRSPNGSSCSCRRPARPGPASSRSTRRRGRARRRSRSASRLADGHIVPNTTFTARWRVTDADGKTWLGPPVTPDATPTTGSTGRRSKGDLVRVHWYEGGDAFGQRALKIGDDAVAETSQLLGVTETDPIDFFIYADQDEFYDALGPATRENVGGEAHADIRTLFALITPAEINDELGRDRRARTS